MRQCIDEASPALQTSLFRLGPSGYQRACVAIERAAACVTQAERISAVCKGDTAAVGTPFHIQNKLAAA